MQGEPQPRQASIPWPVPSPATAAVVSSSGLHRPVLRQVKRPPAPAPTQQTAIERKPRVGHNSALDKLKSIKAKWLWAKTPDLPQAQGQLAAAIETGESLSAFDGVDQPECGEAEQNQAAGDPAEDSTLHNSEQAQAEQVKARLLTTEIRSIDLGMPVWGVPAVNLEEHFAAMRCVARKSDAPQPLQPSAGLPSSGTSFCPYLKKHMGGPLQQHALLLTQRATEVRW